MMRVPLPDLTHNFLNSLLQFYGSSYLGNATGGRHDIPV
jgi:hypothetical protein